MRIHTGVAVSAAEGGGFGRWGLPDKEALRSVGVSPAHGANGLDTGNFTMWVGSSSAAAFRAGADDVDLLGNRTTSPTAAMHSCSSTTSSSPSFAAANSLFTYN